MTRNVVIIVIDALRADRVGETVDEHSLTPNIDEVAAHGTTFEHAFTCTPNTDPSLTAMETGRYPINTVFHHGRLVTEREKERVEAITPVQQVLSDAGWHTVAIGQSLGRWHSRGFDVYPEPDSSTGVFQRLTDSIRARVPGLGPLEHVTRRFLPSNAKAIFGRYDLQDHDPTAFLEKISQEPFFGLIHLMDTHMPYLAEEADVDRLLEERTYGHGTVDEFLEGRDVTEAQRERLLSACDCDGRDLDRALARYDAAVENADRKVGEFIEGLRAAGLWGETTLFITSDHGESLLGHDIFFDHHGLYDDVFHVPLICNLATEDGQTVNEFVQQIDIAPTVLDLLDLESDVAMDGQSLRLFLAGEGSWTTRDGVFAEEAYTQRRVGIRTEDWKYIRHVEDTSLATERGSSLECGYCDTVHGKDRQLFDLRSDPDERENVVGDHLDVEEELWTTYEAFLSSLVDPPSPRHRVEYEGEDEVLDRLRSLGYR